MKNALIQEITLNLEQFDPEEILISIGMANFEAAVPYVDINIQTTSLDDVAEQKWRIHFIDYLAGRLSSGKSYFMYWKDDHPLLWDYNDLQASLYFSGFPADVCRLYWDLDIVYRSLYGIYQGMNKYLNKEVEFEELMKSNNGLLANDPKHLMIEYAKCLQKHGLKSSIINEREPTFWSGQGIVSGRRSPSLLLIGESYIITDEFRMEKI